MKKRNCRRTAQEKLEHDFATDLRKKTDKQIYDEFRESIEKAYAAGQANIKSTIIDKLAAVKGVGQATMAKLIEAIQGL